MIKKPLRMQLLARPKWNNGINIKMDIEEVGWEDECTV
jgi:hypothetical protein